MYSLVFLFLSLVCMCNRGYLVNGFIVHSPLKTIVTFRAFIHTITENAFKELTSEENIVDIIQYGSGGQHMNTEILYLSLCVTTYISKELDTKQNSKLNTNIDYITSKRNIRSCIIILFCVFIRNIQNAV